MHRSEPAAQGHRRRSKGERHRFTPNIHYLLLSQGTLMTASAPAFTNLSFRIWFQIVMHHPSIRHALLAGGDNATFMEAYQGAGRDCDPHCKQLHGPKFFSSPESVSPNWWKMLGTACSLEPLMECKRLTRTTKGSWQLHPIQVCLLFVLAWRIAVVNRQPISSGARSIKTDNCHPTRCCHSSLCYSC